LEHQPPPRAGPLHAGAARRFFQGGRPCAPPGV